MKKFFSTTILSLITTICFGMSYSEAREQALYLTDKMAYELNLNEQQYSDCYEINLDYLMGVVTAEDALGAPLHFRNADLRHILYDWQYDLFLAADYFLHPLRWLSGRWMFPIYSRYEATHLFYGRPHIYGSYRGGHGRYYFSNGYYASRRPHWNGGLRGHDIGPMRPHYHRGYHIGSPVEHHGQGMHHNSHQPNMGHNGPSSHHNGRPDGPGYHIGTPTHTPNSHHNDFSGNGHSGSGNHGSYGSGNRDYHSGNRGSYSGSGNHGSYSTSSNNRSSYSGGGRTQSSYGGSSHGMRSDYSGRSGASSGYNRPSSTRSMGGGSSSYSRGNNEGRSGSSRGGR